MGYAFNSSVRGLQNILDFSLDSLLLFHMLIRLFLLLIIIFRFMSLIRLANS